VVFVMQAIVAIVGVGAALVVLLTATMIPLWLFNIVSALILVVLTPVGAAAMTYVYGTLAAGDTPPVAPDEVMTSSSDGADR
jgi:hypothetical protein